MTLLKYMAYEKFKTQRETKNKNETAIFKVLSEKPMRFKDLKENTGLSQMGLTAILKRLQNENKIEKIMYENHEAYRITKSGNEEYEKLWHIESIIKEIKSLNSGSLLTYWKPYGIEYSIIQDTTFLSKNEIAHLIYGQNPEYFEKEDINSQSLADEIAKYIIDWIIRYANDKGLKSSNFQDGHLILTYAFDFKKMSEYLKQFEIGDAKDIKNHTNSGDLQ